MRDHGAWLGRYARLLVTSEGVTLQVMDGANGWRDVGAPGTFTGTGTGGGSTVTTLDALILSATGSLLVDDGGRAVTASGHSWILAPDGSVLVDSASRPILGA